jgi:hypothetical protein
MDIRAILKARNLSDENIDALITKPEYASLLESFINEAEGGKTALLKAQEIEGNLKNWNENEVIPYVRKADMRAAELEAQNAALRTHLSTLKSQGYDIPESMLPTSDVGRKQEPAQPQNAFASAADIDKWRHDQAMVGMELIGLSNKHRKLTGEELDPMAEYDDFSKNKRPQETLRDYVARKYDHTGLQAKATEAKQAADRKKIEDEAIERYKKEHPVSANPELASPRPSKFDRFQNVPEERSKSWQTAEGRDKATRDRLSKYTSLVTQ